MTVGYLWGIIGTIGFFAFTLVLEVVKLSRSLKSSDDELASARQKIVTFDDKHNETISDLKNLHQSEMEELKKTIKELSHTENPPDQSNVILPTEQLSILKLLFTQDEIKFDDVAKLLSFQCQTAKYHLEDLNKLSMVSSNSKRQRHETSFSDYWQIEQSGRKYLHDNGEV